MMALCCAVINSGDLSKWLVNNLHWEHNIRRNFHSCDLFIKFETVSEVLILLSSGASVSSLAAGFTA